LGTHYTAPKDEPRGSLFGMVTSPLFRLQVWRPTGRAGGLRRSFRSGSKCRLASSGQPNRTTAAGAVFRDGSNNIEVVTVEQLPVFGGVEARVVERVAFKTTDAFAVGGPACEHQSRARRSMSPKDRKHAPLTVMIQVEEAVPGEDSVEGASQGQRSHI
jgi:hypothetical protein